MRKKKRRGVRIKRKISEVRIGKRRSLKRKEVNKGRARCEERRNTINEEKKYKEKATYEET